jgi:hypothetical protein
MAATYAPNMVGVETLFPELLALSYFVLPLEFDRTKE